jgi:hypothetical protein
MTRQLLSRRDLLQRSVELPLGIFLALHAVEASADAGKLCADPTTMDSAQRSARESLHYTEASPDPAKSCSVCSFFQPAAPPCGSCMIFNGPANATGHCDSWDLKD